MNSKPAFTYEYQGLLIYPVTLLKWKVEEKTGITTNENDDPKN